MYFGREYIDNKNIKNLWAIANNIKVKSSGDMNFVEYCQDLDALIKNRAARRRLPLRHSAVLVNGAVKLYRQEVNKLLSDLRNILWRERKRRDSSESDEEDLSSDSSVATSELITQADMTSESDEEKLHFDSSVATSELIRQAEMTWEEEEEEEDKQQQQEEEHQQNTAVSTVATAATELSGVWEMNEQSPRHFGKQRSVSSVATSELIRQAEMTAEEEQQQQDEVEGKYQQSAAVSTVATAATELSGAREMNEKSPRHFRKQRSVSSVATSELIRQAEMTAEEEAEQSAAEQQQQEKEEQSAAVPTVATVATGLSGAREMYEKSPRHLVEKELSPFHLIRVGRTRQLDLSLGPDHTAT